MEDDMGDRETKPRIGTFKILPPRMTNEAAEMLITNNEIPPKLKPIKRIEQRSEILETAAFSVHDHDEKRHLYRLFKTVANQCTALS